VAGMGTARPAATGPLNVERSDQLFDQTNEWAITQVGGGFFGRGNHGATWLLGRPPSEPTLNSSPRFYGYGTVGLAAWSTSTRPITGGH
jgi:hypothetical protein